MHFSLYDNNNKKARTVGLVRAFFLTVYSELLDPACVSEILAVGKCRILRIQTVAIAEYARILDGG